MLCCALWLVYKLANQMQNKATRNLVSRVFPRLAANHVYLPSFLIGPLCCLRSLWLALVTAFLSGFYPVVSDHLITVILSLIKRLIYDFYFQVVVFQHMYWVTLAVVYITVQSTISIFNFGFILWCFLFLWHGQALYLQPRTRLFRLWKIFIGYNYFTLLAKVCLQVRKQKD